MAKVQFFAYEDLTVASTSVGFTASTYSNGDYASVQVETAPIRFRLDAGTPTASVGQSLEVGDHIYLESREEVVRFRAIRRDGTSATLRCQFGVQS